MTEPTPPGAKQQRAAKLLAKRHAAERRFRAYGAIAIGAALLALIVLLSSIAVEGSGAFVAYDVELEIDFAPKVLGVSADAGPAELGSADFMALVKASLRETFPAVTDRKAKRLLYRIVSGGAAYDLRTQLLADPSLLGSRIRVRLPLDDESQAYLKGQVPEGLAEADRRLTDAQVAWIDELKADEKVTSGLNMRFLSGGDSREPELAGIYGALVGTTLTLAITLLLSFPLGVAAAVYLEEFAPRNRITDVIEVNINNLAAVPSIVFGLLGLAVLLNVFGLPRSAPLVGGIVLALMTLPTVIISARSALAAVPPSIREAALGIGASPLQVVGHHVLPLAMPGILTGTIIGMARALGETAPLLLIGMVAFIVDVPDGFTSPATALPVQVYLWADSAERAFAEKTSGAILVLLAFLILMNLAAVLLRNRFERRW